MMQKHTIYKIISFILLPVAALLTLMDLMVLMVALANPPMLLPVFMLACVAIYVFTSFTFLNKGIIHGKQCKPSLKDWIKVNAIVTIIFAVMGLTQVVTAINHPSILPQIVDQTLAIQNTPTVSKETLLSAIKGMLYVLGLICALLLIHIIISFKLLKQYSHLFKTDAAS